MTDTVKPASPASPVSAAASTTPTQETYPIIGLLCLSGIVLHLFFSGPLMSITGFRYSDDDNGFWEKQHPGTYLVLLSFILLLWRNNNPIGMLSALYISERVFTCFLVLWVLILAYMIERSGAKGLSFLIDTQICAIPAALVLSRTPASYCRVTVNIFIVFAVLNSLIGIGEGIAKEHLFPEDEKGGIVTEAIFRASAYLGQPLHNAMFTSVMIFITAGTRLPGLLKCVVCAMILCVSLVAFGGRTALIVSCLGLGVIGMISITRAWRAQTITLLQVFLLMAAVLLVPALFAIGLYGLVSSSMGERLFAESNFQDTSAQARVLAWKVFNYMKPEEIIVGMAPERTTDIKNQMGQAMVLTEIENPWLIMFMHLGLIVYPFWLAATGALIWRLMRRNPLAIKLAVASFFIIASSSNSFGVKGSMYLFVVSMVMCASRSLQTVDGEKTSTSTSAV